MIEPRKAPSSTSQPVALVCSEERDLTQNSSHETTSGLVVLPFVSMLATFESVVCTYHLREIIQETLHDLDTGEDTLVVSVQHTSDW